ncbi:MAG: DEAD/DEAH box helicase [Rhodothermaceae bacterium]|nr:DEAD/DEAH box helicase [Rhodothermaceae bacterium]MYG70704.1 DEAD/DEAH box helicase [Rhodothermaceae bacterium]MYJ45268.1 DEAD/DEAH box helicase [Rhodothermaceae bacterium]
MARRTISKTPRLPFGNKLVLNQWLLSLFKANRFEDLVAPLRNGAHDGLDENNIHHLHHALKGVFVNPNRLSPELLLEYDQNIVKHTQRLNERRITRGEMPITWKYFQYLSLLFCEIYLDRYFRDPKKLLWELNRQVNTYNVTVPSTDRISHFDEYGEAWPQLNKLAFWMATGSGKTLLMHVNILQYWEALSRHGRLNELNRTLLLTPNEGLSRQHLQEFDWAGIDAELFDKNGRGLFSGLSVEILEVTRLRDEMGDKTVAVEAFEGNNLVLVDEGHRGASSGKGGAWMGYRNALCERGFSFEYSATFGQAIKRNPELTNLYAKSTLFDYSYRHFYADGYGKDYQILNLDWHTHHDHLEFYLVACLLTFFQQQRLYRKQEELFRPFNIEDPLLIFVGGRVTATLAKRDASDIIEILQFLDRYVTDRTQSIKYIDRVLNEGLIAWDGTNIFSNRFPYLNTCGLSAAQIFDETLGTIFNAPGGGEMYIENLKGVAGEVALRIGIESEAFGVINVGDDAKLVRLCGEHGLNTGEREFGESLFHELNQPHSKINILIGSKKFTEGWNSWRVSTMGLMNVGKGEGAQIIQLFGRGVRLKGYNMGLMRSRKTQLPASATPPEHISLLETLGVFGIHADYMAHFRDFIVEEGLAINNEPIEFLLPVIKNLGKQPLTTIRIKKEINGVSTELGDAFRLLAPVPTISPPDPKNDPDTVYLQKNKVRINWYPKVRAMKSEDLTGGDVSVMPNETHFQPGHVAFMDCDRLYFELERFKAERGWYKLNIPRPAIGALLGDQSWYSLQIPQEEMIGDSYEKVQMWEDMALALLKKYTERYYTFRKHMWELPHLEYSTMSSDDPNLVGAKESTEEGYYRILITQSQIEIVAKLEELKAAIERKEIKHWDFQGLRAIWFGRHLYQPLLSVDSSVIQISPTPLNKGEREFVEDLKGFYDGNKEFFENRELYLLRNLSRGRGIGFFEAGNFHPDFILWLLEKGQQKILFVDPKGIRNLGPKDPKIQFFETIKGLEKRLNDPSISLYSFIVSNTPSAKMRGLWDMEKDEMEKRNVLFQEEDKDSYIGKMLQAMG